MKDSQTYLDRKKNFEKLVTLYGRNVVLEALEDNTITPFTLHVCTSNQEADILTKIKDIAIKRGVAIREHDKKALSRISKNAQQDQGVALDIQSKNYLSALDYLDQLPVNAKIIALDGINNPQNLGMIIRSIAASKVDAILLPKNNSAKISPLVIKASAGTLFKAKILYCDSLQDVLKEYKKHQFSLYMLSSHATRSLLSFTPDPRSIYILGNETKGVSNDVKGLCSHELIIPMNNGVESLNVAVTAALIAFLI